MPNLPKPRLRRARSQSGLVSGQPERRSPHIEQIDAEGLRWVNIEDPGAPERAWLEEHFDFHALDLEAGAERADIKARFKELVKRHHPDANGGDRGSEDKLREIIQAYNYLKSAGFC